MPSLKTEIDLFISRCVELTSKESTSGVMVPIVSPQSLASFLLDALKGGFKPYADNKDNIGSNPFFKGPLGEITNSVSLLRLTDEQLSLLHDDFIKAIRYLKYNLTEINVNDLDNESSVSLRDDIVRLSEKVVRYLISLRFHPSFLHDYFSSAAFKSDKFQVTSDLRETVNKILTYFHNRVGGCEYNIYTPRVLGKGGEDWGFKSVPWNELPKKVQDCFSKYLSQELNIDPDKPSSQHDESYLDRYKKWQYEIETLKLSKYVRITVSSQDPYSALEEFREQYDLMKDVVYISRKGTGKSSEKSNRSVPETVEKDLQLRTYGWGLKQVAYPDAHEVLLRLHFLRYGKEREVLLEPQDLEGVPEVLASKISTIEEDQDYDPTPGSFCGLCGVTAHCPVMAQALMPIEVLAPATREQAEKAASLLLTLQKMEKELTARLKDWVKEYGPIQVGDMIYGASPVVSFDLDPQKITTILLSAGLSREEVWSLLSLTKTNLEKGLRKLKRRDLLEQALSTATTKGSEKIDFRKVSP